VGRCGSDRVLDLFVERYLAQEGYAVGVVTGVQAISWQEIVLHGRAAHSGTTPTELRIDAGGVVIGERLPIHPDQADRRIVIGADHRQLQQRQPQPLLVNGYRLRLRGGAGGVAESRSSPESERLMSSTVESPTHGVDEMICTSTHEIRP
jgi:hypothetical protein